MPLSRSELENDLIKILLKLMPQLKDSKELGKVVEHVATAMLNANPRLDKEQLTKQLVDPDFQKTLKHAVIMSMINLKEPDRSKHLNLSLLFLDKLDKKNVIEPEKLELELKLELKKLFMKFYNLTPAPKNAAKSKDEENIDEIVNLLTKSIKKDLESDDPKLRMRTMDAILSDVIKMEYGGIDTRHPGSVVSEMALKVISSDPNWVDNEPHIFTKAAIEHRRPEMPAPGTPESAIEPEKSAHKPLTPFSTEPKPH